MQAPEINIETLAKPHLYSSAQLDRVCAVAYQLDRGKFVLCLPPEGDRPKQ